MIGLFAGAPRSQYATPAARASSTRRKENDDALINCDVASEGADAERFTKLSLPKRAASLYREERSRFDDGRFAVLSSLTALTILRLRTR